MSELRSNESPRSGSDKTILFRKESGTPVVSGWYFGRRNCTCHGSSCVIPYYVKSDLTVDVVGVDTSVKLYSWYGSVPEVRILP